MNDSKNYPNVTLENKNKTICMKEWVFLLKYFLKIPNILPNLQQKVNLRIFTAYKLICYYTLQSNSNIHEINLL